MIEWDTSGSTSLWLSISVGLLVVLLLVRRQRMDHTSSPGPSIAEGEQAPSNRSEASDEVPSISLGAIRAFHNERLRQLNARRANVSTRLSSLERLDLEHESPEIAVRRASSEERKNLTAILAMDPSSSEHAIVGEIRRYGSHSLASLMRGGKHVPYTEVLTDVAIKVGHHPAPGATDFSLERAVVEAAFEKMVSAASPEQRHQIEQEIAKQNNATARSVGTAAGGLAVAHLSGFALYTAASSSLAAITGAVGLSLPFAAYTGMSSVIATVTGPVGWAALGAWALFKIGGPNYKRTVPATLAIASVRARNIAERDQERSRLKRELHDLEGQSTELSRLTRWLSAHESEDSTVRVPQSSAPPGFGF